MNTAVVSDRVLKVAALLYFLFFVSCDRTAEFASNRSNINRETLINVNKYMVDKDFDIIRHFVKRKSWRMTFSDYGYYYEIFDEGSAKKIQPGASVTYICNVDLLDGTSCRTNQIKTFVVDGSEEISGLHDAVKYLGAGGKARFIFPPYLGYGLQGDQDKIPPRSTLIYYVKILKIE